jgi:hypothetical protein
VKCYGRVVMPFCLPVPLVVNSCQRCRTARSARHPTRGSHFASLPNGSPGTQTTAKLNSYVRIRTTEPDHVHMGRESSGTKKKIGSQYSTLPNAYGGTKKMIPRYESERLDKQGKKATNSGPRSLKWQPIYLIAECLRWHKKKRCLEMNQTS